ncbi:MAG: hypothetical protein NXI30_18365 [bacterium]|nr:hypothetical protein [bacterium]
MRAWPPLLTTALPRLLACLALLATMGCTREILSVELPTMTFVNPAPPIDGSVEICVPSKLYKRQWNVPDHPYRIELGKRAALNFERMAKTAFREAVAVYGDGCGSTNGLPWIEAIIVSANRDWDGIVGVIDPEPVDTALTMSFALFADDGSPIWSTSVKAEHRVVDSALPIFLGGTLVRSRRGSRDFGAVLGKALDDAYEQLITSTDVRAAFGDAGLEADPAGGPVAATAEGEAAEASSEDDAASER